MDILNLGVGILKSHLEKKMGGSVDDGKVSSVLNKLVGSGDSMDIGSLVGSLQSGGLASMATSWLGDGDNDNISSDQVMGLVDGNKMASAAEELGTDEQTLLGGLTEALPQMVSGASSGGSLLDSVGGLGGALGMAKKFF